jgi:hypothetical protein
MSPALEFLESWYRAQCNGYWEHANGITIETLDIPGWMVSIDLAETTLEDRPMQTVRQERSDKDWIVCTVERNRFRGQGDSTKLGAILEVFRKWAGSPKPSIAPEGLHSSS